MKKIFSQFVALAFLLIIFNYSNSGAQNPPKRTTGNYQNEADSLRKSHQTPRQKDTMRNSKTDNMPVVQPDSGNSSMPVVKPKDNTRMPVKELSDTLKK